MSPSRFSVCPLSITTLDYIIPRPGGGDWLQTMQVPSQEARSCWRQPTLVRQSRAISIEIP